MTTPKKAPALTPEQKSCNKLCRDMKSADWTVGLEAVERAFATMQARYILGEDAVSDDVYNKLAATVVQIIKNPRTHDAVLNTALTTLNSFITEDLDYDWHLGKSNRQLVAVLAAHEPHKECGLEKHKRKSLLRAFGSDGHDCTPQERADLFRLIIQQSRLALLSHYNYDRNDHYGNKGRVIKRIAEPFLSNDIHYAESQYPGTKAMLATMLSNMIKGTDKLNVLLINEDRPEERRTSDDEENGDPNNCLRATALIVAYHILKNTADPVIRQPLIKGILSVDLNDEVSYISGGEIPDLLQNTNTTIHEKKVFLLLQNQLLKSTDDIVAWNSILSTIDYISNEKTPEKDTDLLLPAVLHAADKNSTGNHITNYGLFMNRLRQNMHNNPHLTKGQNASKIMRAFIGAEASGRDDYCGGALREAINELHNTCGDKEFFTAAEFAVNKIDTTVKDSEKKIALLGDFTRFISDFVVNKGMAEYKGEHLFVTPEIFSAQRNIVGLIVPSAPENILMTARHDTPLPLNDDFKSTSGQAEHVLKHLKTAIYGDWQKNERSARVLNYCYEFITDTRQLANKL